jgi:NADPH-dependent curcumin reductase CurA
VLLRVLNAGVDPAMRGWLSAEKNYATVPDGAVMRALGVGEVIESDSPAWPVGACAYGWLGWQRYVAVQPDALLWQADITAAPAEAWLSIFGLNGLTAWLGLIHLGKPAPGQTVLVTTAAGGVGGVVGQLAAAHGVHAVGIAGGPDKVARATEALGYAAAIDYRAPGIDLSAAISAACPDGIDVFFDNTAGALADTVFRHLNTGARVIQCGTASVASWLPPPGTGLSPSTTPICFPPPWPSCVPCTPPASWSPKTRSSMAWRKPQAQSPCYTAAKTTAA